MIGIRIDIDRSISGQPGHGGIIGAVFGTNRNLYILTQIDAADRRANRFFTTADRQGTHQMPRIRFIIGVNIDILDRGDIHPFADNGFGFAQ